MLNFRPSLKVSILAFLSCLLVLAWLLFSLFAFRTAANDLYDLKARHARMLLATFVNQLPESIPVYPEGLISTNSPAALYGLKLAEDISTLRLTLLDANGKYIYSTGREGTDVFSPFAVTTSSGGTFITPDGNSLGCVILIQRNNVQVGRAGLLLSLETEKQRLKRSRELFMAYFAIDFILLLWIGAFILSRIVVKPVNSLLGATEKITRGYYGHQITVTGSLELSQLAESFNNMSETLLYKDRQVTTQLEALEKANAELRQAREESLRSEKMASIGLLAAGMAHEIGTPLASITGYAELISSEASSGSPTADYAGRIAEDCTRIDRIIRGLLDYARSRTPRVEPTRIDRVINESLELLTQQGALKHIEVSRMLADEQPEVLVDPHQLQQVLINLMLNSRDAMPDGGRLVIRSVFDGAVKLPMSPDGSVRVDVFDSGSGIPREQLKQVFDPFFTTKPPGKGTGLGLAIVSRIMEEMGGRILVKSEIGKGTCFTLYLPVAQN